MKESLDKAREDRERDYVQNTKHLFPGIVRVLHETGKLHGWCLIGHGSFDRDLDVVGIPWTDSAVSPVELLAELRLALFQKMGISTSSPIVESKPHNRVAYLIFMSQTGWLDLSLTSFSNLVIVGGDKVVDVR